MEILKNCRLLKDVIICGLLFTFTNYANYASIFGVAALSANIYLNSL